MARILQVCNADFTLSKFLAPLVRALVVRGHHVECVCDGTRIEPGVIPDGVRIHSISFPRSADPRKFFRSIQNLRWIIRAGRFDCVNSHNRNGSIVGRIAACLERVPVNLYTARGFYFHDDQPYVMREATICFEAVLARITDFTLSQSQADVDLMVGRRFIDRNKILTIRNGIDTGRFSRTIERAEAEARLGLRPGRFRFCATGRLVKGKGFGDLLNAFAVLHRVHPATELVIIGGNITQDISPFQEQFLAVVHEMGLANHVIVTGITKEVDLYLAASDAFVLPSYREGMPRSLIEAMSMGLPSIATDIRGCNEVIDHGKTGFLYPAHDVKRLSELLREIFENRDAARAMGQHARAAVVERFDERNYIALQVDAIERLVRPAEIPAKVLGCGEDL